MPAAISLASRPRRLNALRWGPVAAAPRVMLIIRLRMPVEATPLSMFMVESTAASAVACFLPAPATSARLPTLETMSPISWPLPPFAPHLRERPVISSAWSFTPAASRLKAWRQPDAISPASLASSKFRPIFIFATVSLMALSWSALMPPMASWPAMSAMPVGLMPNFTPRSARSCACSRLMA